eukprot:Blabericola_migrator_1__12107@NODE_746_length_6663_cov_150_773499_g476_i1_p4_GENE_NODE_746_length_6663_cov_150_773499_g476_i1NODE_746_length_6663_cov_150_773499_g476_i1_p4_ORF_typecomplete_len136_score16_26NAD2/PF18782_1/0_014zfC3HC4/PF00097_25/0_13zfRING_2/PF13639_6/0_064FGase/PF05013_12/0_033zfRING_5/PF14634_6/0_34VPS28/PF03997_12/0_18_NODE_746_length_6663_cov_150_773499_g476_i127183125
MECKICMEDLDASNELEFTTDTQVTDSTLWHPCLFCLDCVQTLINTQYHKFRKDIVDLDCERAIKRLVKRGPPVYIHDVHGFPEAGEEEVPHMRLKATKAVRSFYRPSNVLDVFADDFWQVGWSKGRGRKAARME